MPPDGTEVYKVNAASAASALIARTSSLRKLRWTRELDAA